ncbi:MAG TPA: T9SS type A sorting domain-containing protein, partial [Lentimicrobium sp.]|nr:T9SS type A sorting domain-containing protein [Lentimicrobium sp.]
HVFPNPANDFIIIDYELVMLGKLRLIAQDGRICYSQNLNAGRNQLMICLNNFSPGVYIATIVQDKKVISSKFTVK